MNESPIEKNNVLVIGAGIAGIEASLMFAKSNRKVFLVEKTSYIGGSVIKYEEVFSNMECSTCMVAPKQQELLENQNIELLTLSKVSEISGSAGNFKVKVNKKARYVDMEACIGCSACFEPCPVTLKNDFEECLSERKAIFIPCEGALPNVPCIDTSICVRFNEKKENCEACKEACMFEAIDYDQKDETLELDVGAIVVATGFNIIDLKELPQYGYGKYEDVYSAFEMERLFASNGPTTGEIVLKNGNQPKTAAIIHCVGREEKGYCSGVCCMYSLKFVNYLKSKIPEISINELYSDLCIPGKTYQKFYEKTNELGVNLYRAKDITVSGENGGLQVSYKNEIEKDNSLSVDMVILAQAIVPRNDADELAKILDIAQDENGFFKEEHFELGSVSSPKDGIFIVGCAQGPKDIQSSVAQADAAVGKIMAKNY
jgi:heterodisulfide reductase subunit A